MESFFALLQKNVLDRQRWATRADLRLAIISWIERTYYRRRRQKPHRQAHTHVVPPESWRVPYAASRSGAVVS
jgi:hypothetical protein